MIYSVKQLADKLRQEQFDVKNFPIVFEDADGNRQKIIDVWRDDKTKEVVMVSEKEKE